MTPQEIIKQVEMLPPPAQREVLETLARTIKPSAPPSEAEIARRLLAKGTIKKIPEGWDKPDGEDFEPIEIKGKPLSEMILEDRN